ncbi:MAG: glycosyltransferase [Acidobacteria bacterium]|nr:glycosyltransferase [Acidobacteriota bacterium]
MSADLSIVIPTSNGLDLLRENLPSVQGAAERYHLETGHLTEIIVVDDGSHDGTREILPAEFPDVSMVTRQRNEGFAKACNTGFEAARFPLVALLNNDVRIEEDYFLYQTLHFTDPDVFAVTAKVFEWDQSIFAAGGRFGHFRRGFWSVYFNYDACTSPAQEWIEERRLLSAYAIGGFSTYSREKLQILGGFNELLSPFHWEDVDLSYRGWKRGWEVRYEPRSVAHHRASATIKAHYKKKFVDSTSFRNRLLFHWINLHSPSYLLRHLLMVLLLTVTRVFVLDLYFYRSLGLALGQLPEVLKLRRLEQEKAKRTDVEISRILNGFYDSAPIEIYYNQQEVIQKHPEFEKAEA